MKKLLLIASILGLVGCDNHPHALIYCHSHQGIKQFVPTAFNESDYIVCNDGVIQTFRGNYIYNDDPSDSTYEVDESP